MRKLAQKYANDPFEIVSISWDDSEEKWKQFVQAHEMTWSQYRDADHALTDAFGVKKHTALFHDRFRRRAECGKCRVGINGGQPDRQADQACPGGGASGRKRAANSGFRCGVGSCSNANSSTKDGR